jgi:hypothetical protein
MKRNRSSTHTAPTSAFNGKLLPKWAKIIPPRSPSDPSIVGCSLGEHRTTRGQCTNLYDPQNFLEKQGEDDYLRTLTYHSIAQFLEHHLQQVLETLCSATVRDILQFKSTSSSNSFDVNIITKDVIYEQTATSLDKIDTAEIFLMPKSRIDDSNTQGKGTETSQCSPDATSTSVDSENDVLIRKCTLRKNSIYDPLLLPVFSLDHGPFTMHDKLLVTSHLLHQIQKAEPRTCCVSLPSSNYHHYNVSLQEDFMDQCWNQEMYKLLRHASDVLRKKVIQRRLKKIKCTLSITDQLVLWSSETMFFDNIVIFWNIEHGCVGYNHHSGIRNHSKLSFEHFIQWCAERRVTHGIPISIVLYNPKNDYRQSMPFYSSMQSMIGLRLRDITTTPDTTTALDHFWKNIISDIVQLHHPTAILLYSICQSYKNDVSRCFDTFKNQDQSITRFIRAIKVLIAKYLSLPSNLKSFPSTVAVLCHRPSCSTNLLKRITSLLYDSGFSKYLVNNGASSTTAVMNGSCVLYHEIEDYEVLCFLVPIIMQLYSSIWDKFVQVPDHHHMHSTLMKSQSMLPVFLLFDSQQSGRPNDCKFDSIVLKNEDRRFLVSLLFKYRTELCTSASFSHGPISSIINILPDPRNRLQGSKVERILSFVNELIVLFDYCISLQDVLRCLESFLVPIILQSHTEGSHPIPLPRRDHVHALLDVIRSSHETKRTASISIPGCMYEIIQKRISITEAEWYKAFLQRYLDAIDGSTTTGEMFPLFACGIRHLQISGLIRRSVGKNSTVQYERTALVWCDGD